MTTSMVGGAVSVAVGVSTNDNTTLADISLRSDVFGMASVY